MIDSPILGVVAIGGVSVAALGAWLIGLRFSSLRGRALDFSQALLLVFFGLVPLIFWGLSDFAPIPAYSALLAGFASNAAFDLATRRRALVIRIGLWASGIALALAAIYILIVNQSFALDDKALVAIAGLIVVLLIFRAGLRLRSLIAGPRTGLPTPSETGTPA